MKPALPSSSFLLSRKWAVENAAGRRTSFGHNLRAAIQYAQASGGTLCYRATGKFGGEHRTHRWLQPSACTLSMLTDLCFAHLSSLK